MELSTPIQGPIVEGKNYINGNFIEASGENIFKSKDPATGEILGFFPESGKSDVDSAYHFARDSFYGWRQYSRVQRAEYFLKLANIIEKRKEEIAKVISLETGKVYNESIAEVIEALDMPQ